MNANRVPTMSNKPHTQLPVGTYGFIGLGNMGYGMAMNVRKKMPTASTLVVCELDQARRDEFCSEAQQYGQVDKADTPKEIAERSVRHTFLPSPITHSYSHACPRI